MTAAESLAMLQGLEEAVSDGGADLDSNVS